MGIIADTGDQIISSYWVQISVLDCIPREQLEDEMTFLVIAQSLPHIPLKQCFRGRLVARETQRLTRVFAHDV